MHSECLGQFKTRCNRQIMQAILLQVTFGFIQWRKEHSTSP